ncbi:MAG TPA: bifunctional nicotinamidase/pyrazinamidase [Gaiellaceae bacterium]
MDAFLIVDFQNDFTPGGALPVPEGDAIAEAVNSLLERFPLVVATRDWHPPGHGSFVDSDIDRSRWRGTDPPGIWPVHCVQGTPGAELHPSLDAENVDVVLDKGQDLYSQGYSAFQDTELGELLRDAGVERLYVAGLATDYCVRQSVLDALERGFEVVVVEDAIRGVDVEPGDSARAIEEMRAAGARLERAAEIEPLEPA